ncbi:MAG: methionyl-tRNA formyltransferase [Oscillospiraceae bacterium]|nr:methionyl-tRNA formyltransferase [Oscillospiraceae bacterium]
MKILFMGTPDFAAAVLDTLSKTEYEIIGAVSQPDKPKGRGHKLVPTAVKMKAEELDIPVFQPETMKNESFKEQLEALAPDMIIVAAYGKLLPRYIIDYPRYGCINVHASLLPKYRGAAPIQWSVINGETKTGVSIMRMDYGLDTGDVIGIAETPIGEYETSGELFLRLAEIGGSLLVSTIGKIIDGTAEYVRQNDAEHTYAPMINKETAQIDWTKSAAEISKLICGMNPAPAAQTTYKGSGLKIYEAEKTDASGSPGEILGIVKKKGLLVSCGSGALYLKSVQFAGAKRMNAEDYARGHEIETGAILGISIDS